MQFPATINSQEEFDGLVKDRLGREQAKFADYDDLKAKATAADQAKSAYETQIAEITARATAAEEWKTAREQSDALTKERDAVAKAAGIPADALKGASKADFEAHAEILKPLLTAPRGPVIPNQGDTPTTSGVDEARAAVRGLFGGADD